MLRHDAHFAMSRLHAENAAGARSVPASLPIIKESPTCTSPVGGFTLIEVLVVIALIGIFAAILITAASGVRDSASRARGKVQFAQWAAAIEAFRGEYGHYPQFDTSHKVNGGAGGRPRYRSFVSRHPRRSPPRWATARAARCVAKSPPHPILFLRVERIFRANGKPGPHSRRAGQHRYRRPR